MPRYWLMKTEPESFSWDDLQQLPGKTTAWDGVRNYMARNLLRDEIKKGDLVLFYHSRAKPPAVVGTAKIVRSGYPDPTQFDAKSKYYDAKSSPEEPRWFVVDVRAQKPLKQPVTLPQLRDIAALEKMELLRKGNRLSVQPVTAREWKRVLKMGGLEA